MRESREITERFVKILAKVSLFIRKYSYFTKKRLAMLSSLLFLNDYYKQPVLFGNVQSFSVQVHGDSMKLNWQAFNNFLDEIDKITNFDNAIKIVKQNNQYQIYFSEDFVKGLLSIDSNWYVINDEAYDEYSDIHKYLN